MQAGYNNAMLSCQRAQFEMPPGLHYLNGAYMSPLSRAVLAAGRDGLSRKAVPTRIGPRDFFIQSDEARARFARVVNAPAERIAIIPSASYGVATVAHNLATGRAQNIVILHEQFPSNVYGWRRLAAATSAQIRTVQPPKGWPRGEAWNTKIIEAIDSATAVVALPHVHWTDGTRFDLAAIGERARAVGAALIVDGTQSVGALPFDVDEIRPDALITAAYKWLMGPYGIGFAYYGERFSKGVPLEENWITRAGAEDFSRLVDYQEDYAPGAVRFDMGERSNPILLAMAIAAMDEVLKSGVQARQAYCRDLIEPFMSELAGLGIKVEAADWRASHLFGLHLPSESDVRALERALGERHVIVSIRGDAVRVSPNVYNDADDMAALVRALRSALN